MIPKAGTSLFGKDHAPTKGSSSVLINDKDLYLPQRVTTAWHDPEE
jgi:hypothetical protein